MGVRARLAVAIVKKSCLMFDVYFDSKYHSEQLFHSMSEPNMARLAVAMAKNHV